MKLLLDENLSPKLVKVLSDIFPGTQHVEGCGMSASGDSEIWEFAKANGYAILSKDRDFVERASLLGWPPKVIWLHVGNCTTAEIERVIRNSAQPIRDFLDHAQDTCLEITRRSALRPQE
jgi:predicted nuclease of predicted toxin-antitoxin system